MARLRRFKPAYENYTLGELLARQVDLTEAIERAAPSRKTSFKKELHHVQEIAASKQGAQKGDKQ